MFAPATAAGAASFGIKHEVACIVYHTSPVGNCISLVIIPPRPQLSDTKLEDLVQAPSRIASQWLGAVQERLQQSIIPKGRESENDGRWLSEDIAGSASAFFEITSDILPSEPYIYSSKKGDLVAEFENDDGIITGIITQEFVVLFAMVDGTPVERTLVLGSPINATRSQIQLFMEMLRTKRHGAVESRS